MVSLDFTTPQPPKTLIEHALDLAARSIPVFPCSATKQPVCAGGHLRASTNAAIVRSLFGTSLAKLIGMPTGEKSGMIAIDIDPRNSGERWLATHEADLPATRRHGTMNGGVHLMLKDGGHGIKNSAGMVAKGVDVRGNGGYVILPPSPGYSVLDDAELADMPQWLIGLCLKPETPPQRAIIKPVSQAIDNGTPYGIAALAKACDAIRGAYDGVKHETINREAYSMGGLVTGGELLEADAWRELSAAVEYLRPACKDFRAAMRTLRRSFDEGKQKPRDVPELVKVDEIHPAQEFLDIVNRASKAKPLDVKADIMNVDGVLKQFVDYCEATAISPQPFLALAAGIAAIGALAGRKYRTKTNLRTNVYAIGVADSGGGKDHARKRLKDVFLAADLLRFIGGEDIASGTAVMTALARHPCILFQIDEFGDWLHDVIGQKAASHKKQIAQRLKTLYSTAGSFVSGTEYADQSRIGKPKEDIQQPHACLYGTTTPGQFWRSIADGSSMEDGLLARFLIFVSPESYPDERDALFHDPPAELVTGFKIIADGPENGNLASIMTAGVATEPYLVDMTVEAEAAYKAMRLHQLARQRKHAGTSITAITARLAENATKLALIHAISRDPVKPVIKAHDIAWGRALAEHCIDTLLREADENVGDTPYARNMKAGLKLIRKHGPITEYELVRKGWKIPDRDRREILQTLMGTSQIVATEIVGQSVGRRTVRYSIGDE